MQDSHDRLNQEGAAKYRSIAASVLYLSLDQTSRSVLDEIDDELSIDSYVDADHGGENGASPRMLGIRVLCSRERRNLWMANKTLVGTDGRKRKTDSPF
eukprot:5029705-Amphidinium_carterae.1